MFVDGHPLHTNMTQSVSPGDHTLRRLRRQTISLHPAVRTDTGAQNADPAGERERGRAPNAPHSHARRRAPQPHQRVRRRHRHALQRPQLAPRAGLAASSAVGSSLRLLRCVHRIRADRLQSAQRGGMSTSNSRQSIAACLKMGTVPEDCPACVLTPCAAVSCPQTTAQAHSPYLELQQPVADAQLRQLPVRARQSAGDDRRGHACHLGLRRHADMPLRGLHAQQLNMSDKEYGGISPIVLTHIDQQ